MYEGQDDYYDDDDNDVTSSHNAKTNTNTNHALNVGLRGGNNANQKYEKKKTLNQMLLKQRLALQKEEKDNKGIISTKRIVGVKGQCVSKEVTFIPKDVLRKNQLAAENKRKQMEDEQQAKHSARRTDTKRNRRGIQDLRLKTPFKNQA